MKIIKLFAIFCLAFFIAACGEKNYDKGNTNSSVAPVVNQPRLSAFAAQCSYGSGGFFYRVASDPDENKIYFGSVLDQQNINAIRSSGPVDIFEDRYEFTLYDVGDNKASKSTIYRKDGDLIIENPPEYQKYSGPQNRYSCTALSEGDYSAVIQLLKAGNAAGLQAKLQKQQEYTNKPNKF